jgi:hypothetical protein
VTFTERQHGKSKHLTRPQPLVDEIGPTILQAELTGDTHAVYVCLDALIEAFDIRECVVRFSDSPIAKRPEKRCLLDMLADNYAVHESRDFCRRKSNRLF